MRPRRYLWPATIYAFAAFLHVQPGLGQEPGASPPAGPTSSAADSIQEGRLRLSEGLRNGDLALTMSAWDLLGSASEADRLRVLFTVERVLRLGGRAAEADSVVVLACRALCGAATDRPEALAAVLDARSSAGSSEPTGQAVRNAVRSLLAEKVLDHLSYSERQELGLTLPARLAVENAVTALLGAGQQAAAAELLHARAYLLLPEGLFTGSYAYAAEALEVAQAALKLRRQAGDRLAEAGTLSVAAVARLRMSQPDSARVLQRTAEELAAGGDNSLRGQLRRRSALVAATAGDAALAERLIAEAAELRGTAGTLDVALDRLNVVRALLVAGLADAALRQSTLAYPPLAAAGVPELGAHAAKALAEAHRLVGHADSAKHYFQIAAGEFRRAGLDEDATHVLAALAEQVMERGLLDEADFDLGQAEEALRRWPWASEGAQARILNDRGLIVFGRGDWQEARSFFEAARAQVNPQHVEHWEAARNIALVNAALGVGELQDLEAGIVSALARANPVSGMLSPPRPRSRPLTEAWLTTFTAVLQLRDGDVAEAYTNLRIALGSFRVETTHDPSLRRAQSALGSLFVELGRPDSGVVYLRAAGGMAAPGALAAAEAALASGAGARTVTAIAAGQPLAVLQERLAASRVREDRLSESRALQAIGSYYFRRRSPADPGRATEYFDSAFAAMRSLSESPRIWSQVTERWIPVEDWFWVQLSEQFTTLQEESTFAWLARESEIGQRAAAAGSAAVADRSRGLAFDALARVQGSRLTGIAADIFRGLLEGPPAEVGERLFDPSLTYGRPPAALSYLFANDTIVIWRAVPHADTGLIDGVVVTRRSIARDSLDALVTRARGLVAGEGSALREITTLEQVGPVASERGLGVAAGASGSIDQVLEALAAVILPPDVVAALGSGGELLVVAGGPLASVPFAALPIDGPGSALSNRFAVRYATSLASQHSLGRTEAIETIPRGGAASDSEVAARRAWLERAVVVGNPTMPLVDRADGGEVRLAPLPGAEAEAVSVARLMGVTPLTGPQATTDALRARAPHATVIHLATHGFAYGTEDKVADSFVALAPDASDDGVLTVSDLLSDSSLRFPVAELVVLSACQTGLGQHTASEGTLGLQRAFLAAGARNVLVSLWSVSDEATSLLLQAFYRHWLEDPDTPSKAEALRRAQEDVRATRGFEHPRFWSAFQLVGSA